MSWSWRSLEGLGLVLNWKLRAGNVPNSVLLNFSVTFVFTFYLHRLTDKRHYLIIYRYLQSGKPEFVWWQSLFAGRPKWFDCSCNYKVVKTFWSFYHTLHSR